MGGSPRAPRVPRISRRRAPPQAHYDLLRGIVATGGGRCIASCGVVPRRGAADWSSRPLSPARIVALGATRSFRDSPDPPERCSPRTPRRRDGRKGATQAPEEWHGRARDSGRRGRVDDGLEFGHHHGLGGPRPIRLRTRGRGGGTSGGPEAVGSSVFPGPTRAWATAAGRLSIGVRTGTPEQMFHVEHRSRDGSRLLTCVARPVLARPSPGAGRQIRAGTCPLRGVDTRDRAWVSAR